MFYLVATFGDGPYWRSGLEVLLYPTGCSFYRPFSYQKSWAVDKVAPTRAGTGASLDEGVVGYRFKGANKDKFLPLRRISNAVVAGDGDFHVRFTLGDYINHTNQFTELDLSANHASLPGLADDKILLVLEDGQFKTQLSQLPVTRDMPDGLWKLITNHSFIGKSAQNAPEFRTTLLRFLRARELNSTATVQPEATATDSPLAAHGFKFTVGKAYEIGVEYRMLMEPGATEQPQLWNFHAQMSDDRMVVSRPVLVRTGNYRQEALWIRPRVEEPGPCLLEWIPKPDEEGAPGQDLRQALSLRVPYITVRPSWLKFSPRLFWTGIAAGAATVAAFIGAMGCAAKGGKSDLVVALTAIGAMLAPTASGILAFWFQQWHAMKR